MLPATGLQGARLVFSPMTFIMGLRLKEKHLRVGGGSNSHGQGGRQERVKICNASLGPELASCPLCPCSFVQSEVR